MLGRRVRRTVIVEIAEAATPEMSAMIASVDGDTELPVLWSIADNVAAAPAAMSLSLRTWTAVDAVSAVLPTAAAAVRLLPEGSARSSPPRLGRRGVVVGRQAQGTLSPRKPCQILSTPSTAAEALPDPQPAKALPDPLHPVSSSSTKGREPAAFQVTFAPQKRGTLCAQGRWSRPLGECGAAPSGVYVATRAHGYNSGGLGSGIACCCECRCDARVRPQQRGCGCISSALRIVQRSLATLQHMRGAWGRQAGPCADAARSSPLLS